MDSLGIPNYTLIEDKLKQSNGMARAGLLIHKSVKYSIRDDLTNQQEAHIAVAIHINKGKKLLVHSWYRQWQELLNNKKKYLKQGLLKLKK